MFNALLVTKDDESGKTTAAVTQMSEDQLPAAEVTVAVEYSTVNYKDALCIGPGGGLVRTSPACWNCCLLGSGSRWSNPPRP